MIFIIIKAQLGNQLFSIFNGISIAMDNNLKYCICYDENETTIYENKKTYFNNLLDKLKNNVKKFNKIEFENIIKNNQLYKESNFHYEKILLDKYDINKDIYIEGYYQSYKYFNNNYNNIIQLLNLKEKQNNIKARYNYMFNKKTIAIHFRIGDYIYLQNLHPIQNIKYYFNAINKINEILNINNEYLCNYNILYFCQECDNTLVLKYINRLNIIYNNMLSFIKINDSISEWEQLLLMSCCDNFIIGNSTYSWFGAYLSNNSNKIVFYPEKWFGDFYINNNTLDLFPNSWISITDK